MTGHAAVGLNREELVLHSSTPSSTHRRTRHTGGRGLAMLLALCGALAAGVAGRPMSVAASPLAQFAAPSASLAPGTSATFQVQALAVGAPGHLPAAGAVLAGLAPAPTRATLYYGGQWGYLDSDPQQV